MSDLKAVTFRTATKTYSWSPHRWNPRRAPFPSEPFCVIIDDGSRGEDVYTAEGQP